MTPLSWFGIMRLGLVQMALGMIVVLTTATMNRVMVVELAMPAILPGLLVSLYYGTQFLRPRLGHGADGGQRRAPWIVGGVCLLASGATGAALSLGLMETRPALGIVAAIPAFILIGLGIGAAGTNLLALLASRVADGRQAAAGSLVWIMMIFGLAATGIIAGIFLDPYSHSRLVTITLAVCGLATALTCLGVWRQDVASTGHVHKTRPDFRAVIADLWQDRTVRGFTLFVFASMLAYNLQDLILEPFAGHVFGMSVGQSTQLGGMHHAGALVGMILVLLSGTALSRFVTIPIQTWITGGCLLSGVALIALAIGGQSAPDWPLTANIFVLGLANGSFAVAAIGAMMQIAGRGDGQQEGVRMGLFGAAQAIAFGLGSFLGTAAADIMRALTPTDALAYGTVFGLEGIVFLIAAGLAARLSALPSSPSSLVPGE